MLPDRIYYAPGVRSSREIYNMLEFGRSMRDQFVWKYPIIPGAIQLFQTMSSNREFKVSGTPTGAPRALEYINNARTRCYDGTIEYGLEQWEKRRSLDYVTIGKTMFTWNDQYIDYLDPVEMRFNLLEQKWLDLVTQQEYPVSQVVTNLPIPIGSRGYFVSPIMSVIPSAMLQWLIREHDSAAADGRKIRDIKIVLGQNLAEQIGESIKTSLELWNGANPAENGVDVVYYEDQTLGRKASDLVASLSLANIPENFNRESATMAYVNEIANATGLAMRQFWNDERGTNRALEDVQEQRQVNKGPGAFVRTEQNLINSSGCLKQFGKNTRMTYIEEIDSSTRRVNAEVIELYSRALGQFAQVFGGNVNGEALYAWLVSEDILPADLDLITDIGTIAESNPGAVPGEGTSIQSSNQQEIGVKGAKKPAASQNGSGAMKKSFDEIDYDEISLNKNGEIIDRRRKVFRLEKSIASSLEQMKTVHERLIKEKEEPKFFDALSVGRKNNFDEFAACRKSLKFPGDLDIASQIPDTFDELTTADHHKIFELLKRNRNAEEAA